jgi:hypothetical protein
MWARAFFVVDVVAATRTIGGSARQRTYMRQVARV